MMATRYSKKSTRSINKSSLIDKSGNQYEQYVDQIHAIYSIPTYQIVIIFSFLFFFFINLPPSMLVLTCKCYARCAEYGDRATDKSISQSKTK